MVRFVGDDRDLDGGALAAQGFDDSKAGDAIADHDDLAKAQGLGRIASGLGRGGGDRPFLGLAGVDVDHHRPGNLAHAGETRLALQSEATQRGQFVIAGRRKMVLAFADRDGVGAHMPARQPKLIFTRAASSASSRVWSGATGKEAPELCSTTMAAVAPARRSRRLARL